MAVVIEFKREVEMSFEIFTEKCNRVFKPAVSICKNYYIRFNKPLIEKYGLDKFKYVVFYFNVEIEKIGMVFSVDKKPHAYRLHVERSSLSIGCKSFIRHYNVLRPQKNIGDIGFENDMLIVGVEVNKP